MEYDDNYFMGEALKLAARAAEEGEIPVGAVVACQNTIIARAYNQTQKLNDVTAHAEMLAITAATQYLGAKYLTNCTLYITLEPCIMCAGAIFWSQVSRVVYGAEDKKRGYSTLQRPVLHPKTTLLTGVRGEECQAILLNFFKNMRT
ncbi:MAG: nucleoside deaminase [Bacteroidota bacterium]